MRGCSLARAWRAVSELGYMLRALRNTLISQRRARIAARVGAACRRARGGLPPLDDPAQTAELREVHAAISELPEEFRDALVAVDIAGLSYGEAAGALGCPRGP